MWDDILGVASGNQAVQVSIDTATINEFVRKNAAIIMISIFIVMTLSVVVGSVLAKKIAG